MPLLFVLWFWSAVPWGFHGVTLTPGWASIAAYESEAECAAARDAIPLRADIHMLACLPAGAEPQGAIAEMLPR